MNKYFITVFTPTFNRAHTLGRVYNSLLNQNFKDFEWIIVDDGSTDSTMEIVSSWIHEGKINIKYFFQNNSGKPTAYNFAITKGQGLLFTVLDSDDAITDDALLQFKAAWDKNSDSPDVIGISCLCMDESNILIGDEYPYVGVIKKSYHLRSRYSVKGEKWGCYRTDILQKYPFPIIFGEKFIPEGIVWNELSANYYSIFINKTLRVYFRSPDSLSNPNLKFMNPIGFMLFYISELKLSANLLNKLKYSVKIIFMYLIIFKKFFINNK